MSLGIVGHHLMLPFHGINGRRHKLGPDKGGLFIECLQVRTRGKMPGIGEGNGFLPQLQDELLRLAGDASGQAMVHDTDGNRVLARFQ